MDALKDKKDLIKQLAANSMSEILTPRIAAVLLDQSEIGVGEITIPVTAVFEAPNAYFTEAVINVQHFHKTVDPKTGQLRVSPKKEIILKFKGEWE